MKLFRRIASLSRIVFLWVFICLTIRTTAIADLKRIILLETMPVPVVLEQCRFFTEHLAELGYENGKNLDLIILKANGDRVRAERILKNAINKNRPDLVATSATLASQTAAKVLKGTNIPIVFFTVSDPVGAGLIQKIGIPTGTNITGKVHMIDRRTRINMVMHLVGKSIKTRPIRIGFIHSSYASAVGDIRELKEATKNRNDIVFIDYRLNYRKVPNGMPTMLKEVKKGIEVLKDQVDFWWEPSGPLGEVEAYSQMLIEHSSAPIVMGTKLHSVKLGALLHLTPNTEATGREAAKIADAILKGAHAANIPVVPPQVFDMGINLTTALKLNIVVPFDILKLAGKNVYR